MNCFLLVKFKFENIYTDLNLLDWSVNNYIAVGLGDTMYLWNASDGGIKELFKMENEHDYICSVKWTEDGQYLAVGDSQNTVQVHI